MRVRGMDWPVLPRIFIAFETALAGNTPTHFNAVHLR